MTMALMKWARFCEMKVLAVQRIGYQFPKRMSKERQAKQEEVRGRCRHPAGSWKPGGNQCGRWETCGLCGSRMSYEDLTKVRAEERKVVTGMAQPILASRPKAVVRPSVRKDAKPAEDEEDVFGMLDGMNEGAAASLPPKEKSKTRPLHERREKTDELKQAVDSLVEVQQQQMQQMALLNARLATVVQNQEGMGSQLMAVSRSQAQVLHVTGMSSGTQPTESETQQQFNIGF